MLSRAVNCAWSSGRQKERQTRLAGEPPSNRLAAKHEKLHFCYEAGPTVSRLLRELVHSCAAAVETLRLEAQQPWSILKATVSPRKGARHSADQISIRGLPTL